MIHLQMEEHLQEKVDNRQWPVDDCEFGVDFTERCVGLFFLMLRQRDHEEIDFIENFTESIVGLLVEFDDSRVRLLSQDK